MFDHTVERIKKMSWLGRSRRADEEYSLVLETVKPLRVLCCGDSVSRGRLNSITCHQVHSIWLIENMLPGNTMHTTFLG